MGHSSINILQGFKITKALILTWLGLKLNRYSLITANTKLNGYNLPLSFPNTFNKGWWAKNIIFPYTRLCYPSARRPIGKRNLRSSDSKGIISGWKLYKSNISNIGIILLLFGYSRCSPKIRTDRLQLAKEWETRMGSSKAYSIICLRMSQMVKILRFWNTQTQKDISYLMVMSCKINYKHNNESIIIKTTSTVHKKTVNYNKRASNSLIVHLKTASLINLKQISLEIVILVHRSQWW